jgi:hypothetical protein
VTHDEKIEELVSCYARAGDFRALRTAFQSVYNAGLERAEVITRDGLIECGGSVFLAETISRLIKAETIK